MNKTRCGFWALLLVVLHVVLQETGLAQGTFVVPSDRVNAMGGGTVLNPILPGSDPTVRPFRYQEVFGSTDIALPLGQYYITGVNFRLATQVGPPGGPRTDNSLDAVLPDIEFRMSTTRRFPDGMYAEYDDNHGPDVTVVVPRGPVHVTGTFVPGKPVQEFSVHIPFTEPFLYDRGGLNVLLDIINYGGSPVVAGFDAMVDRADSVSIVVGQSLTAGTVSSVGLVTQFEYTPIPEPNIRSLVSMAFGLGLCRGMWLATRRRTVCP